MVRITSSPRSDVDCWSPVIIFVRLERYVRLTGGSAGREANVRNVRGLPNFRLSDALNFRGALVPAGQRPFSTIMGRLGGFDMFC